MTQPFAGGPDTRRRPRGRAGLPGRARGRAARWSRSAARPTTAASCGWRRPAAPPRVIYRHADPAVGRRADPGRRRCWSSRTPSTATRATRRCGCCAPTDDARRRREVGRRGPRPARARVRPAARRPPAAGRPRAPRPRGAADLGRRRRHRDRDRAGPARRRDRRAGTPTARRCWSATTTPPAASCTATTWPPARWSSWTPRRASSAGRRARPDGTVELAWSSPSVPPVDPPGRRAGRARR